MAPLGEPEGAGGTGRTGTDHQSVVVGHRIDGGTSIGALVKSPGAVSPLRCPRSAPLSRTDELMSRRRPRGDSEELSSPQCASDVPEAPIR